MDTRQLRHFLAVAATLHFGRAAARLGMTQPPLSQSIRALEAELGAALFQRTRRSVALTGFGAAWLPHVRAALAAEAALPGIAAEILGGRTGRLALSFVSTADYSLLPRLVQRFRALYPQVALDLTEATSDRQIAQLAAGEGQAGIIIADHASGLPPGFAWRRLMTEPLVAAVPETWLAEGRLAAKDGVLPADAVTRAPLIVFPRSAAPLFHDLVLGYFLACGGPAQVVQEAIQMQTIISLVSAGMGIALVPQSLRNLARTGVVYLDLAADAPILETGLVWRQGDDSPTLARFLDVVAEVEALASRPPAP